MCVSKPFDAANGSADYRDYGEQGQINASFGYRAGCDAGASYLAYELHNLLMLLGFVGRIRRLRRIRDLSLRGSFIIG